MDPQNIPPQTQPTESVFLKPNRPFLLLLIIGGLLLILLIGGGAFYLGTRQVAKSPITNLIPTQTTFLTPTLVPTVVQDETANWKIYTNDKWGYSFSYPTDWQVELAGYSTDEPNGYPFVSKIDGSYKSIIFSFSSIFDSNKYQLTKNNGLDLYIYKNAFGGDSINDIYVYKLAENKYISIQLPVNNPNIPVKPDSPDVKTAEQIAMSLKTIH